MLIVLVIAATVWRARPILFVLLTLLALRHPAPALVVTVGWVVVYRLRFRRGPTPDDEAALLDDLVSELDGGASPRAALLTVARSPGVFDLEPVARMIEAGMPSRSIARALRAGLPHNGRLAAAAWALAGHAGAPAAPVMTTLARRAAERGRLERERRAATAQARATAWVIAGLPLGVLVLLGASGRIGSGPALPLVVVGVALQVAGLGLVVAMLRRAS